MAKILLVEDDEVLAGHVKESLTGRYGHHVDHVIDGNDGLYWLTYESFALAILDWNLPGLAGTDICRQFRQSGGQTPILMLTGNDQDHHVIQGLDSGADDYLAKPFKMDVLRARMHTSSLHAVSSHQLGHTA